jgi:hypothetical protein
MVPGEESLRTSMSQDVHGIDRKGKQSLTRSQIWLYVMGYVVLVAGSVGSVWVYRRAAQSDANDAIIPGVYDTKKYQDQLERYGGKANILATEIREWFAGLWHGRHLAYTLAVLAFLIAFMFFYIALFLPDFPPAEDERAEGRGGLKK